MVPISDSSNVIEFRSSLVRGFIHHIVPFYSPESPSLMQQHLQLGWRRLGVMHKRSTSRNRHEKRNRGEKKGLLHSWGDEILWLSDLRATPRPGDTNVRYNRLNSETLASVRLATYTHSGISTSHWRPVNTQASSRYEIPGQLVYRSLGVQI